MPNIPLLPKQPEPVACRFDEEVKKGVAVTVYKSVANSWIARGYKATPLFESPLAQPVIPEQLTVRMAEEKALSLGAVLYDEEADVFADGWNACRAEMLKAQQNEPQNIPENIPAQPVSEPKPLGYFSYGSEHGFDWHKTEKEAIESAEAAIDDYRGDACDGWSEETDSVCWGVILQQATKVDERPRTDDDKCDPVIDTVCDYALLPALEG